MNNKAIQERATDAWKLHTEIKNLYYETKRNFLELGKRLCLFEENKGYKDIGYESFNQYLADPEGCDISRSMAYRLIGVWREFERRLQVPRPKLLGVGPDKLELLKSKINLDEDNVDQWLIDASVLSRSDLRIRLDGREYEPPTWNDLFVKMHRVGDELRRMNVPSGLMNIIIDFLDYSVAWIDD